jgi:serine/threonine protein phosphatase PrpC
MATFHATSATPLAYVEQIHDSTPDLRTVGNRGFEAHTQIGYRPTQEDRLVLCPSFNRPDASFFAIFDGTVGDDASHFCQQNMVRVMLEEDGTFISEDIFGTDLTPDNMDSVSEKICRSLKNTFLKTDQQLIEHCAVHQLHYASSTGVAAFLWKDLLTVAHVGDSKACIARLSGGHIMPEWLTIDHKPHMASELARIESSGGSLAWLHGNKPYIRGGDFHARQAKGDHPKQLNYSRAFGGKDLKCYGLIAEPDVSHFRIHPDDKLILLASDGLWDVVDPKVACDLALQARRSGRSASKELVEWAIMEMPSCGVRDNVTVIAVFLDTESDNPQIANITSTTNNVDDVHNDN